MYSILDRSYRVWCSFLPAYHSEYGQMLSREYLLHSQVTAHQSRDVEFFQILSPISLGKGLDAEIRGGETAEHCLEPSRIE